MSNVRYQQQNSGALTHGFVCLISITTNKNTGMDPSGV